ncbi:agmatine deiminase family protein [Tichowtungia aerotolerans]|uniref:Agmatine deiminase n=1 Tax=Tichowtungia aerotolerans TaxID=2697043 RepID=A0A6P1MDF5_9BACT|nr:agmatine deiminase family protein [Tichowtungia aerotolerans]QHI69626.1 agmatine deiminase [Tichowtungia aerotolerans]
MKPTQHSTVPAPPHSNPVRFPAEWEPQDAVLIAWPHTETDWAPYLDEAEKVFLKIAEAVTRFETLIVATPEPDAVREKLPHLDRVRVFDIETNDTWARDFGPITIFEDGKPLLLDFTFTGWGGKFEAGLDDRITSTLHKAGAFGETPFRKVDLILEGGSIESDGEGTLLTTTECLLNPNRNEKLSKEQIEKKLTIDLGSKQFQWLENGALAGDDTDAHIDTLARLCPNHTILYVQCDDPTDEHFEIFQGLENELKQTDFRLIPLPWPKAKFGADGDRLPATYANYLVINDAVLVPTYNDPADFQALETVQQAFPDREIIGIDCSTLIRQHGSLHCVTMQIPQGVLK